MRSWTIAFSFGVLLASRLPMLPPIAVCQTLVAVACLLHWRADLRLLAAALLGASWLGCYGGNALQQRWTATSDWRDVWVEATVQDLPTATKTACEYASASTRSVEAAVCVAVTSPPYRRMVVRPRFRSTSR